MELTFIHPSLSGADGGADAEEGRVSAGEWEGDGVEDVVGEDDEEVESQVDGVRGRVVRGHAAVHDAGVVRHGGVSLGLCPHCQRQGCYCLQRVASSARCLVI